MILSILDSSISQGSCPVLPPVHTPQPSKIALPPQIFSQSKEAFSPPQISQSSITAEPPHSPKQSFTAQVPLSAVASGL